MKYNYSVIYIAISIVIYFSINAHVNATEYAGHELLHDEIYFMNNRCYDSDTGSFISKDAYLFDGPNLYGYALNNPINYTDESGNIVETIWDAANIAYGGYSLYKNVRKGDWSAVAWDSGGLVVDVAATCIPFIPGGAASALKARRAGASMIKAFNIGSDSRKLMANVHRISKYSGDMTSIKAGQYIHKMSHMNYLDNTFKYSDDFISYLNGANKYTGRQPDFRWTSVDGLWGDVTTAGQWSKHERLYNPLFGHESIPIIYEKGIGIVNYSRGHAFAGASLYAGRSLYGYDSDPGGVLIDKAAELINGNLSDIKGVTFDPVSHQMIFMGLETNDAMHNIDLDYMYTAIRSVYGSAEAPMVSIDNPAIAIGSANPFTLLYNPYWPNEDEYVNIHFTFWDSSGNKYMPVAKLKANSFQSPSGNDLMTLSFDPSDPDAWENELSGINLSVTPLTRSNPESTASRYSLYVGIDESLNIVSYSYFVAPDRHHRRFGGRIDNTKMGWVMFEADRVMKCLALGEDNLTGEIYDSNNPKFNDINQMEIQYENLNELIDQHNELAGNIRMWFVPDEMLLKRCVDEETGQSTVLFDVSTVKLLSENQMIGGEVSPIVELFTSRFNDNYKKYKEIEFPVNDPSGSGEIINIRIFQMLEEVMKAVSVVRFFRDNNIPLDMWWLNSWKPNPVAIEKSVKAMTKTLDNGNIISIMSGGVEINKPNEYIADNQMAGLAGGTILGNRPDVPNSDIDAQIWTNSMYVIGVDESWLTIAQHMDAEEQASGTKLIERDLEFASSGTDNISFTRYYNSAFLADGYVGPGWNITRYTLEFDSPSWFDKYGLMYDEGGERIWTDDDHDTRLHSGLIRFVDRETGEMLSFQSSLELSYSDETTFPRIEVLHLNAQGVPVFEKAAYKDGSILLQDENSYGYKLIRPDGTEILFDHRGDLLKIIDNLGYYIEYTYIDNELVQIGDSTRDKNGNPDPQIVTLAYSNSRLTTADLKYEGCATGQQERICYFYNANGYLSEARHLRSESSVRYYYNDDGQMTNKVLQNGLSAFNSPSVDVRGRTQNSIDLRGNTFDSAYTIDAQSLQHMTTITDNESSHQWQSIYDDQGRLLSFKDATEAQYFYGYDEGSWSPNSYQLPIEDRQAIEVQRNEYGFPTNVVDPDNIGALPQVVSYNAFGPPGVRPYNSK